MKLNSLKRKCLMGCMCMCVIGTMMTGCSKKEEVESATTTQEIFSEKKEDASADEASKDMTSQESETNEIKEEKLESNLNDCIFGKITAIDGQTITIETTAMPQPEGETIMQEKPEMPELDKANEEAPQKPDGELPEKPVGDTNGPANGGTKPEGEGIAPVATGETRTITVSDTTTITKLEDDNQVTISLEDLAVDDTIFVTADGDNVISIEVK